MSLSEKKFSFLSIQAPTLVFFLFLVFFSFILYGPAFLVEFGFHNDGSMLSAAKDSWLGFRESKHILMVGRALGAVLATPQCWTMHSIADFTPWRIIALVFILIFIGFLIRFLRVLCFWEFPWPWLAGVLVLTLPPTQLSILWVAHFCPGVFTVVLSGMVYYLFDKARGEGTIFSGDKRWWLSGLFLWLAFLLFVAALSIYPPSAMTVFIFTFARTIFSPFEDWQRTRRKFLGDLIFFGLGMLAYRIVDRMLVYPWGALDAKFWVPTQPEYAMGITNNLTTKFALWGDSLLVSAAGPWHLLWGKGGAAVFLALLLCAGVSFFFRKKDLVADASGRSGKQVRVNIEKCVAIIVLLILANLPSLLAEACFQILGYRVLWVPSVMLVLFLTACLKRLNELKGSGGFAITIQAVTIVIVLVPLILLMRNVSDVARNQYLQFMYIRSQLTHMNLNEQNRILLIVAPRGETLIERKLPFEFSYMITENPLIAPFIVDALKGRPDVNSDLTLQVIVPVPHMRIDFKKSDFLINLNEMRIPEKKKTK